MAVRVKVKIKLKNKKESLETNALLNAGFETEAPEVIIPENLARRLKLFPELPPNTIIREYDTAGGVVKLYFVKDILQVRAFSKDGKERSRNITASCVISEIEKEVIFSDILIDELNIILDRCGKGFWKFRGSQKLHQSVEAQIW